MKPSGQRIRILERRFLKPEAVETYRRYHAEVWPELEALYRKHGITGLSCFLNGRELCVYVEYDPEVYDPQEQDLQADPVERRWQALMRELNDEEVPPVRFQEVYRLPLDPGGNL